MQDRQEIVLARERFACIEKDAAFKMSDASGDGFFFTSEEKANTHLEAIRALLLYAGEENLDALKVNDQGDGSFDVFVQKKYMQILSGRPAPVPVAAMVMPKQAAALEEKEEKKSEYNPEEPWSYAASPSQAQKENDHAEPPRYGVRLDLHQKEWRFSAPYQDITYSRSKYAPRAELTYDEEGNFSGRFEDPQSGKVITGNAVRAHMAASMGVEEDALQKILKGMHIVHTYAAYMHRTTASLILDCADYDRKSHPNFVEIPPAGGREQQFFLESFEHYKKRNPQAVRLQPASAVEENLFSSISPDANPHYDSDEEDEAPIRMPVPLVGAAPEKGPYTIKKIDVPYGSDWEINIPKGELSDALEECFRLRDVERELYRSGKITHYGFSRKYNAQVEKCEEMLVGVMGEVLEGHQLAGELIQDKFHRVGLFTRVIFENMHAKGHSDIGRALPITEEDKKRGVEAVLQIESDASYRLRKSKAEENTSSHSMRSFVKEILGERTDAPKKAVIPEGVQRFIQAIDEGEIQIFESPPGKEGKPVPHIKRFRYTSSLKEQAVGDLKEIRAYFKIPAENAFPRITEQKELGYVDFGLNWEKEYLPLRDLCHPEEKARRAPPEEEVLIGRIRVACDAVHARLPGASVPVDQKQIEKMARLLTLPSEKSIFSSFKNTLFSKELKPADRLIAHLRVNAGDARSVIAIVQLAIQDGLGDTKKLGAELPVLEKLAQSQPKKNAVVEPQQPRR